MTSHKLIPSNDVKFKYCNICMDCRNERKNGIDDTNMSIITFHTVNISDLHAIGFPLCDDCNAEVEPEAYCTVEKL